MRLDHRDGTLFRLQARRNTEVNKSWLCDEGRYSLHELNNGERVERPLLKGGDGVQAQATWDEAAHAIDARLKEIAGTSGANAILGFASPSATNEALYLFKQYIGGQIGTSQFDFRADSEDQRVTEKEDDILRHRDKHPNTMGALKLDLMSTALGGIDGAIRAARDGKLKAGMIIYFKPLVPRAGDSEAEAKIAELVNALEYSVVLAAHKADWQQQASVVLPVAAWSEEDGTYTNYQGRVQLAAKAIEPGGDILPVWEVFAMLLHVSGAESRWMTPDEVLATMIENTPAFRGLDPDQRRSPGVLATA
jgi:NADH-quinone oxidoreductase subunit G